MSSESELPSPKRQRIRLACVPCRDRKTRCDGRQPICEACETRGVRDKCTYEPSQRQSKDFRRPSSSPRLVRAQLDGRAKNPSALNSSKRAGLEAIDGLATVPAYDSTDDFYGPSSNVAFSRAIFSAPNGSDLENRGVVSRHLSRTRLRKQNNFVALLPKRHTADELLRCFWDFIHPVFPILHKSTFLEQYNKRWTNGEHGTSANENDIEDAVFESTLNLVFATGSKFSPSISLTGRDEVANNFYETFRRSYSNDFLDCPSLPIVQMLLLEGVYLQSSHYASRCWNIVGLAIRVAQSLGLHTENANKQGLSQLQSEVRHRVWHNCVSLDRLLSMTSGRPNMITGSVSVPLPLTIDDEYLSSTGVGQQPPRTFSYLSLFTSSCRLFDILIDVLKLLSYDGLDNDPEAQSNITERLEDVAIQTLKINRRLEDFLATTPPELNLLQSPPASIQNQYSILNLQQQVLYCRFLYVRMLSLRPILMHTINTERITRERIIEKAESSLLSREFIRQCCHQCVETAQRLVTTIYENLGTPYRSAGWHAVYFVFSAATCTLAASQSSMTNTTLREDSFNAFWDRCLAILHAHEAHIFTARRAIKVLEVKKQRILSNQSGIVASIPNASLTSIDRSNMSGRADDSLNHIPENAFAETFGAEEGFDIHDVDITWLDQCLANLDWLEPSNL